MGCKDIWNMKSEFEISKIHNIWWQRYMDYEIRLNSITMITTNNHKILFKIFLIFLIRRLIGHHKM